MRVVVAEDSALMRDGLVALLQRFGHTVCAAVGDAPGLVAAARQERPDLVVADVRMPPGHRDDGLRAAVALRTGPGTTAASVQPVLVLSQYVEKSYAERLLDSGDGRALGYLLKNRVGAVADFIDAAERVSAGHTVIDPEVVRLLLARRRDPVDRLTPREREVLALMAEGRSNAAIAAALVVTGAAINKHIGNIFAKLDLTDTADEHRRVAAVLAYLRS